METSEQGEMKELLNILIYYNEIDLANATDKIKAQEYIDNLDSLKEQILELK